jgi:hypothetical protein
VLSRREASWKASAATVRRVTGMEHRITKPKWATGAARALSVVVLLVACTSTVAPSSAPSTPSPSASPSPPSPSGTLSSSSPGANPQPEPSPSPSGHPGQQFGVICGLIREELVRDDCDPVIFALLQTQSQYGQIRKNIELGGFTCGSAASCPGPETREGLHFVAGAQVNHDERPSYACWNVWLPDENSVLKPSLTLAAADAPGCWPSVVKGGLSFDHRMGATDVILSMVETPGGFNSGNRQPFPVFQLFGDGHVVYRHIDPGVSTGPELEAQLDEDQVQELLRFALYDPGNLAEAEPLYKRASFGPAGSTVFEINIYRFTARVEYQLPPGNLLADKDPAIKRLKLLDRRLIAFDPTLPPNPKPTPIPLPTYLKSPGPTPDPASTPEPRPEPSCFQEQVAVDPVAFPVLDLVRDSRLIAVATFAGYGTPVWTTSDGHRPTQQELIDVGPEIIRPVNLSGIDMLRGDAAELVATYQAGGQIGCDYVTFSDLQDLTVGMRYVVFFLDIEVSPGSQLNLPWVRAALPLNLADVATSWIDGQVPLAQIVQLVNDRPYWPLLPREP